MLYQGRLAYDGTKFFGWQSQPGGNTVQDLLEQALQTCLRKPIRVTGASRTDSGVHAEGQIFSFHCDTELDLMKIKKSINALTPADIVLCKLSKAKDPDFHPIRDARAKIYRYSFCTAASPSPFVRPYVWHCPGLTIPSDRSTLDAFVGHHSFKSFAASDGSATTFDRNLIDIELLRCGHYCHLYFLGEGFLKQMIRNIVGTLVDVWRSGSDARAIALMIAAQDRQSAGQTAPASGLTLASIFYQSEYPSLSEFVKSSDSFPFQLS